MEFSEFLKKISSALVAAEASAHTSFDPRVVIERGTLAGVLGGGKKGKNRLEKSGTDGRITMNIVSHKNFLAWPM